MSKNKKQTKAQLSPTIRDRIVDFRRVRAGDLVPNPKNWRTHPKHQQEAMLGVLAEIGYADAVLARELPDGKLELVDGHLRQSLDPEQLVPTLVLDLDEGEADKLMLTLDPLAAMAEANKEAMESLLSKVHADNAALQTMLEQMKLLSMDEFIVEPNEAPESVAENIGEIEDMKRQRRRGNENTASKNDTERYLVLVYSSREAREQAAERLGLPADERYVAASSVDVRLKGDSIPIRFTDGIARKAAEKKHSGAGG